MHYKLITIIILLTASINVFAIKTDFNTGSFQITSTVSELVDTKTLKTLSNILQADDLIEWQVHVPKNYNPQRKPGLMVYISPTPTGKIPAKWLSLMEKHNLIWVGANSSGNNVDSRKRLMMAILATSIIDKNYIIDLKRVYVAGFSGGGRMASIASTTYPQLFNGAIYICGVNYWGDISHEGLEQIKKNRFVFITGRQDFNLQDTKKVFRKYKKAGMENIKLLINPIMGHSNPSKKDFESAIIYLDNI